MQRFFSTVSCLDLLAISAKNQPELYHQMTRVLRMQILDHCAFFEEGGDDGVYEITGIDKHSVTLDRISTIAGPALDFPRITLFQSLPNKLEKLEFILQKGVETGISEFVFFHAERSQKLAMLEKKKGRLEQIVVEAVEQSGGNRVPKITFLESLDEALQYLTNIGEDTKILVAHTDGLGTKLRDVKADVRNIWLFVGPEGGFAPGEVAVFWKCGATFLDLGNRILRTETAGMVMAFVLKQ